MWGCTKGERAPEGAVLATGSCQEETAALTQVRPAWGLRLGPQNRLFPTLSSQDAPLLPSLLREPENSR